MKSTDKAVVAGPAGPASPVRQVRRAPDHFVGRICYPPYHFFAVSVASVVLTCDLIPSKVPRFIDKIIINDRRGSCHQQT